MIKKWWIESKKAGVIKKKIYPILQLYYNFGTWHIVPINDRPYGLEVVRMLDELVNRKKFNKHMPIVEIGCGLGDIIGGLKWKYEKKGYDISKEVLEAGAFLHPGVKFYKGSFRDVECGDINCVIMVNFIHMMPYEKLKQEIDILLKKNYVRLFVLDTFINNKGTEYAYSHDGEYLFGGKYKLARRSEGFPCAHGATRYVEYWRICK